MVADRRLARDPEFPNLRPQVSAGYRSAPATLTAEVIDGELHLLPRPRPRHSNAATRLARRLGPFYDPMGDDPGGWVILVEPGLRLGELPDLLDPDAAGWRRERLPEAPEAGAIAVAPDWVCEILSDRTRAHDRVRKMPAYFRAGVDHVWLIDPEAKTLEVFRRVTDGWLLAFMAEGDAEVRAAPFAAMGLDLAALWAW